MSLPSIIAIDGPAASGKSTLGKKLADDLGYLFFDTGLVYRALTWAALQRHISPLDESALAELAESIQIDVTLPSQDDGRYCDVLVDGVDVTWQVYSPEVDRAVSPVSAHAKVRAALLSQQRRIGLRGKVVMVGRDIGTVVLPQADLKIYLEASVEERARRRYKEMCARGEVASFDEILASIRQRDHIDTNRSVAPLRPAADAIVINSDSLDAEQVFRYIKECYL